MDLPPGEVRVKLFKGQKCNQQQPAGKLQRQCRGREFFQIVKHERIRRKVYTTLEEARSDTLIKSIFSINPNADTAVLRSCLQ